MDNETPEEEPAGPMPDVEMPNEEPKTENSEIDGIFDKLNTENQAAVIKYAKSMLDGNEGVEDEDGNEPPIDDEMPMEGKKSLNKMISEIINNVLSDEETNDDEDRRDGTIRNKKVTKANPFVSGRQSSKRK